MEDKIKNFFGFSRIPFSKNIPTSSIFISSQIKEVSARLMLAVQNEDVALLTGAVGCGKSTAIRFFVQNLDPSAFRVIYLPAYPFKIGELAKQILDQLHIQPQDMPQKLLDFLNKPLFNSARIKELNRSSLLMKLKIYQFLLFNLSKILLILIWILLPVLCYCFVDKKNFHQFLFLPL